MKISKAILIGFGNHGRKKLFPSLLRLPQIKEVMVFDLKSEIFSDIKGINTEKTIETTSSLNDVLDSASGETFVVIGSTAKDHLSLVQKLSAKKIKYLYIEKPLAQSLSDCDEMVNIIKENNIKTAIGFYNEFLTLVSNIEMISQQYNLGKLLKITSEGGASCLATVGIHLIDMAQVLFRSDGYEVTGRINSSIKSPRGEEYFIYDGLVYVVYQNKRELLLSYNNKSINSVNILLTFEYGYIEADYDSEYIKVMGFKEDNSHLPKYHCKKPIEIARITNNFTTEFNIFFENIFCNLLNGSTYCDINRAQKNMQILLGAFISSKIGRTLELPLAVNSEFYHEKFSIT